MFSSLAAEQSDFIRFNGGKVRQIGNVSQGKLTLRLIDGERQAYSTLTVSCEPAADFGRVASALKTLREGLCDAPDDPHLMVDRSSSWTQSIRRTGTLPDPAALARTVAERAKGLDFVGFYAGGSLSRGFASSSGSRGWYEVDRAGARSKAATRAKAGTTARLQRRLSWPPRACRFCPPHRARLRPATIALTSRPPPPRNCSVRRRGAAFLRAARPARARSSTSFMPAKSRSMRASN